MNVEDLTRLIACANAHPEMHVVLFGTGNVVLKRPRTIPVSGNIEDLGRLIDELESREPFA